jgi:hypothetical protein
MTSEIDNDTVVEILDGMLSVIDGESPYNAVAAASCLITEILSGQSTSQDMAMVLLNTAIMTISVNMEQRMRDGGCSWQMAKQ